MNSAFLPAIKLIQMYSFIINNPHLHHYDRKDVQDLLLLHFKEIKNRVWFSNKYQSFLDESALQIFSIFITPVSRCVFVCLFAEPYVPRYLKFWQKSSIWNRTFPVELRKLRSSTPWPWPLFSRSTLLAICYFSEYHANGER